MKRYVFIFGILVIAAQIISSCKKEDPNPDVIENVPKLIFIFEFDSTQVRLNNFGDTAVIPAGHGTQNPIMNAMSAHYIELAQSAFTQVGNGAVLYKAPETTEGGATAIDFSKDMKRKHGEKFFEIPLKNIAPGTYEYLRVSLAYQNFDVQFYLDTVVNVPGYGNFPIAQYFPATVASFVGYNTFIKNYTIKTENIAVNANKLQGYWGFETKGNVSGYPVQYTGTGQAPSGATTVVNPIASTSPIPAGSCLATGKFNNINYGSSFLQITGNETQDIIVRVSLSTNKSFEWIDGNGNGKWEPSKGESVVDMGIRGMIAKVGY